MPLTEQREVGAYFIVEHFSLMLYEPTDKY